MHLLYLVGTIWRRQSEVPAEFRDMNKMKKIFIWSLQILTWLKTSISEKKPLWVCQSEFVRPQTSKLHTIKNEVWTKLETNRTKINFWSWFWTNGLKNVTNWPICWRYKVFGSNVFRSKSRALSSSRTFHCQGKFWFFRQQLPLIIVKFSIENRSLSDREVRPMRNNY